MPVPSDIVAQRDPAAPVQEILSSGIFTIGITCTSRGTNTLDDVSITRTSGSNIDTFPAETLTPIRSVVRVVAEDLSYAGEEYYPDIHFRIVDATSGEAYNPTNLGSHDDPADLEIDWSIAPKLLPPAITAYTIQDHTGAGGFIAETAQYYGVTVIDHNGTESTLGPLSRIVPTGAAVGDPKDIQIIWKAVSGASGYRLYRGLTDDPTAARRFHVIADGDTISYTDENTATTVAAPTTNDTMFRPAYNDTYTLYYNYADFSNLYDKPTTYYTIQDVVADHGVGSVAANLAKLVLSPMYANAPAIAISAVRSDNIAGHMAALTAFEGYDVQFVACLYGGEDDGYWSDIGKNVYAHCESLSDPVHGQMERFAILAAPYVATQSMATEHTLLQALQNTGSKGKFGFLVCPDNFEVTIDQWTDIDGEVQLDYILEDAYENDLNPQVFSICTVARYCGFRDPAEPLTEKDIRGFTFQKPPLPPVAIEKLRDDWGALFVENRFETAVVSRSINAGLPVLSLEDGEMSIACTENLYIIPDLRRRVRKYRGKKMLQKWVTAIKTTVFNALTQYKSIGIIVDFTGVTAWQDPAELDKVRVSFSYMPVYPINRIWIFFTYTITTLSA